MPKCILMLVAFSLITSHTSLVLGDDDKASQRSYVVRDFRIFYSLEGKSAIPADDQDASGVPDRVEDFAKQLWVAQQLFCEVLKFPTPVNCQRYPQADCIEVFIRHRDSGNGTAFDGLNKARVVPGEKPARRSLVIAIGNHVDPTKNVTPAHEFFHLVQYGATYFKNPWYLEGMTRWSEHAVWAGDVGKVRYAPSGPWPQDSAKLKDLFPMSYDAEFLLWNPIAKATDQQGTLPTSDTLRMLATIRYSNGKPVLQDMQLTGAAVMRDVLLELGQQDDRAFRELNYEDWSEKNQRSSQNDPYIYQAVVNVLRRHVDHVGPYEMP